VCKDFESYFIEEVLKEVKENMTMEDDDEDSSMSTLKDFYMDEVIEEIADEVLDQQGSSFTQTLYEQMKRNYSIDTVTEDEVESAAGVE
jgi:flagellar protein FlgJ